MYEKLYTAAKAEIDRRSTFTPTGRVEKSTGFLSRPETNRKPVEQDQMMGFMEMLKHDEDYYKEEVPNISAGGINTTMEAIGMIESSGNYSAKGEVLTKGMFKGDRAYGKYQVMGRNVPVWTKQALGTAMTKEEFLADPKAQDLVAEYKMQSYFDKHGTWDDVAAVWFTGNPVAKMGNVDDGFTSAPDYLKKFRNARQTILGANK